MLSDKDLKAFAPTTKPNEAILFYRGILGLKLLSEDDYALEFDANGTLLRVTIIPKLAPHPFYDLSTQKNALTSNESGKALREVKTATERALKYSVSLNESTSAILRILE